MQLFLAPGSVDVWGMGAKLGVRVSDPIVTAGAVVPEGGELVSISFRVAGFALVSVGLQTSGQVLDLVLTKALDPELVYTISATSDAMTQNPDVLAFEVDPTSQWATLTLRNNDQGNATLLAIEIMLFVS